MDSNEVMEEMAYDMTQSEEFKKKWNKEAEIELSKTLSDAERLAAFKRLLGSSSKSKKK